MPFSKRGGRIERIDARVHRSSARWRSPGRWIGSITPCSVPVAGASTSKERDEALKSMRPELDRLIISLNELARGGTVSDAATTIQTLVGALRSNLVELGELVDSRIRTKERLAELLQALLQIGKDVILQFAPWFDVMELRITCGHRRIRAATTVRRARRPSLDLAGAGRGP